MFPPALMLIHLLLSISKSSSELMETGFNVSWPVGSVTSWEYTTPPMISMYLLDIMVAVWSMRGEGLFSTRGVDSVHVCVSIIVHVL